MSRLPLILVCALLTACSSTPPVRYYTLGPLNPASPAIGSGPGLVVGPVGVPATIDRLLIVRQVDGARADVSDGHRWAAPLKTEIARRLAHRHLDLAARRRCRRHRARRLGSRRTAHQAHQAHQPDPLHCSHPLRRPRRRRDAGAARALA